MATWCKGGREGGGEERQRKGEQAAKGLRDVRDGKESKKKKKTTK